MGEIEDVQLTREQIIGYADKEARRRTGRSIQEIVNLWRHRQLEDEGEVADLLALLDLLPDDDEIFRAA